MATHIVIDDQTFEELQEAGELRVESTEGVPLVVMTVDARKHLQKLAYDDSEWTEAELLPGALKVEHNRARRSAIPAVRRVNRVQH